MLKKMYSLFDKKANVHLNPLHFSNHGEAVRWFTTMVNQKGEATNVSLYPKDFILCYLGEFDDEKGSFQNEYSEVIHGTSVVDTEKRYTLRELYDEILKLERD